MDNYVWKVSVREESPVCEDKGRVELSLADYNKIMSAHRILEKVQAVLVQKYDGSNYLWDEDQELLRAADLKTEKVLKDDQGWDNPNKEHLDDEPERGESITKEE